MTFYFLSVNGHCLSLGLNRCGLANITVASTLSQPIRLHWKLMLKPERGREDFRRVQTDHGECAGYSELCDHAECDSRRNERHLTCTRRWQRNTSRSSTVEFTVNIATSQNIIRDIAYTLEIACCDFVNKGTLLTAWPLWSLTQTDSNVSAFLCYKRTKENLNWQLRCIATWGPSDVAPVVQGCSWPNVQA